MSQSENKVQSATVVRQTETAVEARLCANGKCPHLAFQGSMFCLECKEEAMNWENWHNV